MNTPTFAARIRAARELRGMSAAHLASLTGIAAANISHYEAGQRQPGVDSLRALALMLDISMQIEETATRNFALGASQDDARIAQAEARGFLAGREAAAKVADEDEALYTGEAIEAAVAKRIRDAIRALEPPKGNSE